MSDLDKTFRRIVIVIGSFIVVSSLALMGWLTVALANQPEIDPANWILFGLLIMLMFTALRFVINAVTDGAGEE